MRRKALLLLLTVIVALVVVGGTALAITYTTSKKASLKLNRDNFVGTALTMLASNVVGPVLTLDTDNTDSSSTPLNLRTETNDQAPMTVNSDTKVANLNADQLDGKDSTDLQPNVAARVSVFDPPINGIPSEGDLPGTRLSFNEESYDTRDLHSNTTNNSRLTAPVSGVYQINAIVYWYARTSPGDVTKARQTSIIKNADQSGSGDQVGVSTGPSSSNAGVSQPLSTQVYLQAGDYVEVWVWQSSGVSLDVGGNSQFEMTWVARG